MKNIFTMILMFALAFVSLSCMGEDGAPGSVYLRYSWNASTLQSYGDDTGLYYISTSYQEVSPGTYDFSYYTYYDGSLYHVWGTFTLRANAGEKGQMFWTKGTDGSDRYYTMYIGLTSASLSKAQLLVINTNVKNTFSGAQEFNPSLPILTKTLTIDGGTVVYKYQEEIVTKK